MEKAAGLTLIGLTGLYCAGKNHVGRLLEKQGIPVLDLDVLGHEAIRYETAALARRFGAGIINSSGEVERRALGRCVFGQPQELAALETITHPVINRLTGDWLNAQEAAYSPSGQMQYCVINAAVIHKFAVFEKLNALIVVYAPLPLRLFRAVKRDNRPLRELLKRFSSQKNFPRYTGHGKNVFKTRREAAEHRRSSQFFFCPADKYSIRNFGCSGSPGNLERQIQSILEGLRYGAEKTIIGSGLDWCFPGGRSRRGNPHF